MTTYNKQILEDMCDDEMDTVVNFYKNTDGKGLCKRLTMSKTTRSTNTRKQPHQIIPVIQRQREKDRNAKHQVKRTLSAQKKSHTVAREQLRATTERRQKITAVDYTAIAQDNELADEFLENYYRNEDDAYVEYLWEIYKSDKLYIL
jgi:hypothetical protein